MPDDRLPALLEEIRKCIEGATPGPWTIKREHGLDIADEAWSRETVIAPDGAEIAYTWLSHVLEPDNDLDAEFIAKVREFFPRLLAVVDAVLKQHQPGRITLFGALCKRHESHRHFSITSREAADVQACQDCTATVYNSCTGCGPQVNVDLCPTRNAITRALTREGDHAAT